MAAAAWVLWLSWAASAAAGSPPAKELTDLPPPILVHYAYAGSDTAGINEFRLRNLKFFLRHAVTISHVTTPVDRVTVSGGRPDAEAVLDAFDNHRNALLPPVHVLHRKNEGYDFGAHWDPGFIGPKVEGFAFAMTGPALAHVVQNGGVFKSHATKEDAIIYGEYGLTRTILEAPQKWNVASLLLEFQNMDFRDNSTWKCNDQQFPSRENTYGPGISVSPLEVLFHKARWESEENNPTVSVSETDFNFYTGWMDEGADRDEAIHTAPVGGFWVLSLAQIVWPIVRTLLTGPQQGGGGGVYYRAALLPCLGNEGGDVQQDDEFA